MNNKPTAFFLFDLIWIISLVIMIILPYLIPSALEYSFFSPAVPCLIGGAMFFSNQIKNFSFVGKILYWTAANIFKPRSKYNHLIWGFVFFFIFGLLFSFLGDPPQKEDLNFFNKLHHSSEYWIGLIAVLVFNILVGFYTARNYKKAGK